MKNHMKLSHHDSLMKAELVNAKFWDLIKLRFPWLVIGLVGGLLASVIVSQFEQFLKQNVALAFFISIMAYMSDAIGSQTETVFIRALTNLKFSIPRYIAREILLGALMGLVFGLLSGIAAFVISGSFRIGIAVGISLFLSMTIATGLACVTPIVLKAFKQDPAVGAGPFTTAVQDLVSLTIYFTIASFVLSVIV